jgi:hypothetical protein
MSTADARRLVLVFGVGRSGTSLITGILGQVGFHIPQPEIKADETNPRGFGESAWVVNFHRRLMRELRVTVFDARPTAWDVTGRVAGDSASRSTLREWLAAQLREAETVVVKDPRIGWFLPLWMGCSDELGVPTASLTTLRHPAEILTSARRWYGAWQTDASRAASWLNMMLETERATRGKPRAFVNYEDLLDDWAQEVSRVGETLDIPLLSGIERERFSQVDEFVDPALHRNRVGWEGLAVPVSVREMAEAVWLQLQVLAEPGADSADAHAELDTLRATYVALYEEAEAIAQSSVTAASSRPASGPPAASHSASGAPTSAPAPFRVRLARRLPKRYRKRLREAARSLLNRSG